MIGTLTLPLAGCFLPNEIIPAAIDVPPGYRAGPRHADAALPSVVWWRGFRSKELTDLIEESLTSNFDVAAAVARIVQADANARVAGAALLPVVDLNGSATRQRASQGGGGGVSVPTASSLAAAARPNGWPTAPRSAPATRSTSGARTARRCAPPRSSRSPAASTARWWRSPPSHRRQRLFPGARRAGPAAHRARQPRRRDPRLQPDQAALRRRHRLRARHRAAGKPGRHAARLDPAAGADLAAEHCHARGADRPHAASACASAAAACRGLRIPPVRRACRRICSRSARTFARPRRSSRPPTPMSIPRARRSSRASQLTGEGGYESAIAANAAAAGVGVLQSSRPA